MAITPAKILAYPLSLVYGGLMLLREWLYAKGVFRRIGLSAPVLCVGNLTMGGTGKTPTVVALGLLLQQKGLRISVLTRGYRGRHSGSPLLVSDGRQIIATAEWAGDEALLLAHRLPGAVVAVGKNRAEAGKWVESRFPVDVHLMDDGFQHLRLKRDLNLLLIDVTNPWSGGLPPLGRLREPVQGIRRADAVLLTHVDPRQDYAAIAETVHRHAPGIPILRGVSRISHAGIPQDKECIGREDFQGLEMLAFAGIGKPWFFFEGLKQLGARLRDQIAFPDHHRYTREDYRQISTRCRELKVKLVAITEKDAMRLDLSQLPGLRVAVVKMKLEFLEPERVTFWLDSITRHETS